MRLLLLKVCNGVLAHLKQKYLVPVFYLDFAREEQTPQLNGLLTGDGLREMIEGRNHCDADAVLLFAASFINRNPGFLERRDLTRISTGHTTMVKTLFFEHREKAWLESELVRLQSETQKFKSTFEKTFAPQ